MVTSEIEYGLQDAEQREQVETQWLEDMQWEEGEE